MVVCKNTPDASHPVYVFRNRFVILIVKQRAVSSADAHDLVHVIKLIAMYVFRPVLRQIVDPLPFVVVGEFIVRIHACERDDRVRELMMDHIQSFAFFG